MPFLHCCKRTKCKKVNSALYSELLPLVMSSSLQASQGVFLHKLNTSFCMRDLFLQVWIESWHSSRWHHSVCVLMDWTTDASCYTAGPSAGVSGSLDSYCSLKPLCLKPLCSGMGEVVPARTSPTLPPPSPRTVLSLSFFKVLQCINCHDWHCKS